MCRSEIADVLMRLADEFEEQFKYDTDYDTVLLLSDQLRIEAYMHDQSVFKRFPEER